MELDIAKLHCPACGAELDRQGVQLVRGQVHTVYWYACGSSYLEDVRREATYKCKVGEFARGKDVWHEERRAFNAQIGHLQEELGKSDYLRVALRMACSLLDDLQRIPVRSAKSPDEWDDMDKDARIAQWQEDLIREAPLKKPRK